ncbi:tRNA(Ile)-lysidine synthase [Thalictrum thalictroides]|uniref:tRNA(Ile)-lysidine synthetase n=1 Tax=Thalictrum thalictroides TaxID=46969 RepID=A0A7J6VQU0_THATH|nr:tRNA(Ile)-lysidine synthase [Thalictrum thalictroides]
MNLIPPNVSWNLDGAAISNIAMGVSGGPDSVALCVLAAEWKNEAHIGIDESNGCIHGLLAIIVDHNLRKESRDEANCVRDRISKMGIRCEVAHCDWPAGKPKQGHLQEMARDMRYQNFQNICTENQIGVLLIAHHADDQAELFILRLSRNSGVLGLAGMAFSSQLFPTQIDYYGETSCSHGILLVRPLLEFSKADLYRICQGGNQEWVEDPTNQSPLFARNRIRRSLGDLSSCIMNLELQAIISACRRTRLFIDKVCSDLINKAVTVTVHGYAIIDLEKLDPLNVDDVCLSKFSALVLQFISQRHRQVRGRTLKLILEYMRNLPCKTSLTAAGCYLCGAPQSKGTKILVCASLHPSEMESSHSYLFEGNKSCTPSEIEQIIIDGKSYSDSLIPDASNVPFLLATSSESILSEGKRLNVLSESTYNSIISLQKEETKHFKAKSEVTCGNELRHYVTSAVTTLLGEPLQSELLYHFMNRFVVTWKLQRKVTETTLLKDINLHQSLDGSLCKSCVVGHETVAYVRHMIDKDWLYLGNLSKVQISDEYQEQITSKVNSRTDKILPCSEYRRVSAQRALRDLKFIPVAARRGLPVLVDSQGLLLSIPSISFQHCPYLLASVVFKPRVPLGGAMGPFTDVKCHFNEPITDGQNWHKC